MSACDSRHAPQVTLQFKWTVSNQVSVNRLAPFLLQDQSLARLRWFELIIAPLLYAFCTERYSKRIVDVRFDSSIRFNYMYRPKCLVNLYSQDKYQCHSFDNRMTDTWPQQITNMREYIYLCCYQTSANLKMSIKTLSPTVIRIGRFYHCWIWINKANMVHVSDHQNSMAFIFHIEYTKLMKTVSWNIRWWKSETQNIDANLLEV